MRRPQPHHPLITVLARKYRLFIYDLTGLRASCPDKKHQTSELPPLSMSQPCFVFHGSVFAPSFCTNKRVTAGQSREVIAANSSAQQPHTNMIFSIEYPSPPLLDTHCTGSVSVHHYRREFHYVDRTDLYRTLARCYTVSSVEMCLVI